MSAQRYLSLCLVSICCLAAFLGAPVAAGAQAAPRSTTGATVTLFSDDFEGAWAWWPASTSSGWFLSTYRNDGGTHSAHAASGIGANAMMNRGPFDLSNATAATLDYDLWYYAPQYIYPYHGTSGTFDFGYSLDGSVFYYPLQWGGDTGDAWAHQQLDLSSLCGNAHVWIAFMVSNASSMYAGYSEGAYLDNVTLTETIPDSTPPITVASGYDSAWHNSAVPVTLTATDKAGGSGVKSITYAVDGGAPTTVDAATTQVTIAAPADHSNDGTHTIAFHATDNAGNTETPDKTCTVKIDTSAPKATVKALTVPAAKATKGKTLKFKVTIADPKAGCGQASLTLKVTTKTGKVVHHLTVSGQPTNTSLTIGYVISKKMAKGSYKIIVSAKDLAGNKQAKAGTAKLTVT